MKYILHGEPAPLHRPRFYRGRVVDVQKNDKQLDGIQIKKQHGSKPLFLGPISVNITFFMQMPKSIAEKGRDARRNKLHVQRPDTDNLIKYILDVCNGILYEDDSLISQIFAKKIWADEGKTEFTLETVNEANPPE